jgi:tetratricopeptide (TPR) repeat protein
MLDRRPALLLGNAMNSKAAPSSATPSTAKRPRSRTERIVTRSLIALLLIVVALEAHARFGHNASVSRLRKDMAAADDGAPINLAAAQKQIVGFPLKSDLGGPGRPRILYRWPSLFRSYVLLLETDPDGDLLSLETDAQNLPDADAAAPGARPPREQELAMINRPAVGWPPSLAGVVTVATRDVAPHPPQVESSPAKLRLCRGALVRELIRQAFLLSAHEELQKNVRDQSLGDNIGDVADPAGYPYEVNAEIDASGQLLIEIVQPRPHDKTYRRLLDQIVLSPERYYEGLLEQMEVLSRTTFAEILRETGVVGQRNAFHESAEVPQAIEERLHKIDEFSQLAAIRDLHALIRQEGESPERLAALARAYSNLGSLTEFHWLPHHKVFKARGLLYAQRLVAATRPSSGAVAHRGYAWALTARLQSALDDFDQAAKLRAEDTAAVPFPRWIEDAIAYCEYDPEAFNSAAEPGGELSAYLHLLSADPIDSQMEYLELAREFLTTSPGCGRAQMALCAVPQLGVRRTLAEGGLQSFWPATYERLGTVSDLPQEVAALIEKQAGETEVRDDEPQDRVETIRLLKAADDDSPGPSRALYGRLLDELSFLQGEFRVQVMENMLGLPADEFVRELKPIVAGHPFAAYIRSAVSDPTESRAEFQQLVAGLRPIDLDFNAQSLVVSGFRRGDANVYRNLYVKAWQHQDLLPRDLLQEMRYDSQSERNADLVPLLDAAAPRMPQVVAQRIRTNGLKDAEQAASLASRYENCPLVLQALTEWHTSRREFQEAQRLAQRRIAIAPEVAAYRALANVYAWQQDLPKWKAALEEALQQPSLGLEHASVQEDLARYHMQRNEWQEALPYAEGAAQSYSAWGLKCAAECYEGLGDMDQAENLLQACGERYEGSALDWYFWCRRTGKGNEAAAKRLAQQHLNHFRSLPVNRRDALGIYDALEGDSALALKVFDDSFQASQVSAQGLAAALLADELQDASTRDRLLRQVANRWGSDWRNAEAADLMIAFLQQSDGASWKTPAFERLLAKSDAGQATGFYYFAGRFLELRGVAELADDYLKIAASSPRFERFSCLLATDNLRKRGVEIPPRRPSELGGTLTDFNETKEDLDDLWGGEKYEQIVERITKALEGHGEWNFLLVDRGLAYEKTGKFAEAVADYEQALERDPDFQAAHHELAMLRAACSEAEFRDPEQALAHAQRAMELATTNTDADYTCLAIALAANGDFAKAVEQQELAVRTSPTDAREAAQERLKLFQDQKPYVREHSTP